jgi:nucleoid-associated protein YgaU
MVMEAAGALESLGSALGLVKSNKAKLVCVGSPKPSQSADIECTFNPTDYTLTQTVTLPSVPTAAKQGGQQQYVGTGPLTFSTNLFFDAFSEAHGDVTPSIDRLLLWMRPIDTKQQCPPLVQFVWGGNAQLANLKGYITNATVKYTLFRIDGTPVRAEVAITITGQTPPRPGPNPTSHASGSRRSHQVIEGDSLQSIAFRELGKATYWRSIAELNGIDDPMRLSPGTVLLMPSVADAARSA